MKICKFCKQAFYRKPTDQKCNWDKKQFCSRTCVAKLNVSQLKGLAEIHEATFRDRYGWSRYDTN